MRETPLPPTAADSVPGPGTSGYVLAVLVLLAGLALVGLYGRSAKQRELRSAEANFVARTDELTALLRQRLGAYELIGRGGVSLFATVARPSRQQWKDYVDGLNMRQRFPALAGLGFAAYVTPGQLSDLQRLMRDTGEGLYSVRPHGPRAHYGPVLLVEPKTPDNLATIGEDLYYEPLRQSAMEAAMASGEARLTRPVRLEGAGVPAVLMVLPVYRAGDHPNTPAARRESMQGWIYAPFLVADFVDEALGATSRRIRLRIVDAGAAGTPLLYEDPPQGTAAFVHGTDLDAYGRRWRLEFASEPLALIESRIAGLRTTELVGVLASLLLFAITLVLARTQSRAERMAARMSESYRRSELRFRNALHYSAIGAALLDHAGRIVEANPALAAILGSPRERLVGTNFGSHFVGGADEVLRSREMETLGEGAYRTTRSLLRSDGDARQAQLIFAPVPGEIGQDITRLVQVEDITDRLRAEAEVLALNRSLEARVEARTRELSLANEELESFAYSVSHDLRAPLRSIDGFSRVLLERHAAGIDEAGRGYLGRVRSAAGRMDELIDSLLKMARLSRGGVHPTALDLSRMAAEVVAELRTSEPERPVEVEIAAGLEAMADRGLVHSLLQNLLGNAWKFTRDCPEPRIEVGCNAHGEFFVRDNGAGFAQEYADKLFRPFQRLHSQDEFSGHGIGLASVKRIVERHGGRIRAEGVPEAGATFYFTLPSA